MKVVREMYFKTPRKKEKIHGLMERDSTSKSEDLVYHNGLYRHTDLTFLQSMTPSKSIHIQGLRSIDELLERDKYREKDGFPRKLKIGRLIKPTHGGKNRIILVPTTVEEKFLHDNRETQLEDEPSTGGSGDGEEGDVIGEEPIHGTDGSGTDGSGTGGAGQGEGGEHEIEASAYDLGRILTERFELPNLEDKGKRRSLTRYSYDLTDKNRGSGQFLDKKATLRKILETNIGLGNVPDTGDIDPLSLVVSPNDKVYRILSKEKDYDSQAMVFFLRDYSGSMSGIPTEIVVSQHILIYSWLFYQYERQVDTRFILHDDVAREVPDFSTYYNSSVAGGTKVAAAYRLVNEIVESESLARDYNIYIFHGTDGEDWDEGGRKTIPELKRMLTYCNRIGITIAGGNSKRVIKSTVERFIKDSRFLEDYPKYIRLHAIGEDVTEERLIQGIKALIS
jgi:uncharacterized sporulation protein YeaH/YhbH (DUF444 family)